MSSALRFENQSISRMEARHMRMKAGQSYIACEDLDFLWSEEEVKEFDDMWNRGASIFEIEEYFNRDQDEIGMLVFCRRRKGKIKLRRGGLFW